MKTGHENKNKNTNQTHPNLSKSIPIKPTLIYFVV